MKYFLLFLLASTARAEIKSVYFVSDGVPMHALLSGDAYLPPALLIHGSPGRVAQWLPQLQDSSLIKHYQLIAIDRPGYGESDTGNAHPALTVQVDVALAALQFNKSNLPITIVGYSYGGAVAAKLAVDHPNDLARLILLAPAIDPAFELPRWYENLGDNPIWLWALPTDWQVYLSETMPFSDQLKVLQSQLSQIHLPIQYIQGEADTTVSTLTAKFAKDKFTGAKLSVEMIPGMTHAILKERPDLPTAALLSNYPKINHRKRTASYEYPEGNSLEKGLQADASDSGAIEIGSDQE